MSWNIVINLRNNRLKILVSGTMQGLWIENNLLLQSQTIFLMHIIHKYNWNSITLTYMAILGKPLHFTIVQDTCLVTIFSFLLYIVDTEEKKISVVDNRAEVKKAITYLNLSMCFQFTNLLLYSIYKNPSCIFINLNI